MKNAWNEIHFRLRSRLFGKLKLRPGLPEDIEADPSEAEFYRNLIHTVKSELTGKKFDCIWDIGAKNGSYLSILAEAFPMSSLCAVEVDGKRRYPNGFMREDYLLARVEALRLQGHDVKIFLKDFREVVVDKTLENQLFLFLFPFVSEDPCLAWGLPKRFSLFAELLMKTREEKRVIVSAHQGEWEQNDANRAYRSLGIRVRWQTFDRIPANYPLKHTVFIATADE